MRAGRWSRAVTSGETWGREGEASESAGAGLEATSSEHA